MKDHKISLLSAILLNLNIMIGSGIFFGSGSAAAIAGNASFLGWLVVFMCFLPLVLSVIKLSQLFPGTGGMYLYAKQGLGADAGFISAWLYLTGYTFTAVVEILVLQDTLAKATGHWFFTNAMLFNTCALIVCLAITLASMKLISWFLNSLTIIKLIPLIVVIVLIPFIINPSFSVSGQELSLLPKSLPLVIFGYFGFEYCTTLSHLIKDSHKNAPRAILLGFLITALIYTLFHFGLLNLMGAENLATLGASKFADFIQLPIPYLSSILGLLIPAAIAIIFFAVALGVINSNATLLHSLAQEKLIAGSSILTRTTSLNRPIMALGFLGIIIFLLLQLVPSVAIAGNLCILAVFCSFLLPVVSLIVIARQRKLRSVLITGIAGLIALAGFIFYSWITLGTTMQEHIQYSMILVISLALGLLMKKYR